MLKLSPQINHSRTQSSVFSAYRSEGTTEFLFNFCGLSDSERASDETAGIVFARDGIVFRSFGSQIRLTVSDDIMRGIFAEILNRKVFSRPAFQSNVACLPPSVEPIAAILRRLLGKMDGENHAVLLPETMLYNLVRHVAHVWPNTNSPELSLSPTERPPLALRLALDYIYSRRGMVKTVIDVASQTNVGIRALEYLFRDRMSIGIRRYCKFIMLSEINQILKTENHTLTQIASQFGISNVARLRKELEENSSNCIRYLYPWEFYVISRVHTSNGARFAADGLVLAMHNLDGSSGKV